jgi:hypothetical protein
MSGPTRTSIRMLFTSAVAITATFALAVSVAGSHTTVAEGAFHAFATGTGLDISGHAQMVRTADGKTIVSVHVEGLAPGTTYGSHVHKQACADGEADGHYRFDTSGPATPPNEIWPGFTTNAAGVGNGRAVVQAVAGSSAISVVVHAPGGAKIACADLG